MIPDETHVKYARVVKQRQTAPLEGLVGAIGVLVYVVGFFVLGMLGADVKNEFWMTVLFALVWSGPPLAITVLYLAQRSSRRENEGWKPVLRALPLTCLLLIVWLPHLLSYLDILQDIAAVRRLNTGE